MKTIRDFAREVVDCNVRVEGEGQECPFQGGYDGRTAAPAGAGGAPAGDLCGEPGGEENNPLEGATVPLLATLREGRPATGQLSLRVKNGHFLPVQLQTVPLRDDRGSLVGAAELFEPVAKPSRDDRRQSKLNGAPPSIAVEFGRRAIPGHERPTFQELEKFIKDRGEAPAATPPAA